MATKIIYITNKCNLNCTYCYEGDLSSTTEKTPSYKELKLYIDQLFNSNEINLCLCLMGGEPFLAANKIRYIYYRCLYKKRTINKNISLNIITNGTLILKNLKLINTICKSKDIFVSLDISYDGSFQYNRTKNDFLPLIFIKLNNLNIPYSISYTIYKENSDVNLILKDLIKILILYFKNIKICSQKRHIRLNFDINSIGKYKLDTYKLKLKKYMICLMNIYNVPICYLTCDECALCDGKDNYYEYKLINKKKIKIPKYTEIKFNHFEDNI